jgi:hypothetical protein
MRPTTWRVGAALMFALSACLADVGVPVICDDALQGELSTADCNAVAAAVIADLGDDAPSIIVVLGYSGCPPGAFCALVPDPPPAWPVSVLVGVRFADGDPSVMRSVTDISVRPMEVTGMGGYDPDAFIDAHVRASEIPAP